MASIRRNLPSLVILFAFGIAFYFLLFSPYNQAIKNAFFTDFVATTLGVMLGSSITLFGRQRPEEPVAEAPRERNDFDMIIDEYGDETEESDLLKLLDIKTDLQSRALMLFITLVIQGAILFTEVKIGPTPYEWLSFVLTVAYVVAFFRFIQIAYEFLKEKPSEKQRRILRDYMNARRRLRELGAGE